MRKPKILCILIAFCLFMIWFYPYAHNELLTWKYGKEFIGLQESTNMIGEVEFLKVLAYSNNSARVYYVGNSGNILSFIKNNNVWQMKSWDTIWSETGSAEAFIWPYFYHSSEGIAVFIFIGFLALLMIVFLYGVVVLLKKIKTHHIT